MEWTSVVPWMVGVLFGAGVAWGLSRGQNEGQLLRISAAETSLAAVHRRADDLHTRLVTQEAMSRFQGQRHDELALELRMALQRIERKVDRLAGHPEGTP